MNYSDTVTWLRSALHRLGFALFCGTLSIGALAQDIPDGAEFRVNTHNTSIQVRPVVASDREGGFVAIWLRNLQDGSPGRAFGRLYDASGNALGGEFAVGDSTSVGQSRPAVSMNDEGKFVVVWKSAAQGDRIYGQRFDSDGNPQGTEFIANNSVDRRRGGHAVALADDGGFVVVWHDRGGDGSFDSVKGRRFDSSGASLGGEFLINSYTTGNQQWPAIAMSPRGDFVVVWQGGDPVVGNSDIFGQRFDASGGVAGTEFQVNVETTSWQSAPQVAMDRSAGFSVVWNQPDGDRGGVFGRRYDALGGALGTEFQVNTYTTENQVWPSVASDDAGNIVVVWQSDGQDGDQSGIFGQRLDPAGNRVGDEFQANSYTTISQLNPRVASSAYGDFVVSWSGPYAYNPSRPIVRRFRTNQLGDRVFLDSNSDGLQTVGEQGVPNVQVQLIDESSNLLQTTETRLDGTYRFGVIPLDRSVFLRFEPSSDWVLTVADQGFSDTLDSDPDPVTGETELLLAPEAGQRHLQWDAGVLPINILFSDGFESGDTSAWTVTGGETHP